MTGAATEAVLRRFNEVFLSHDPTVLNELVADHCAIENTVPAPDGSRHEGREACIALWSQIATTPGTWFELEDVTVLGDRGIIRWRYHWGEKQSVRGVNLMRVEDGLIVEAQGYVKGGP
ncbi:nuclear transport factor 2 family protein [Dongia deserti]|uniref:nuclear transport factor 2 family protein n=1 Tax=Dongia deserti TaxID=2268030 RepID=UPI000E64E9FF|nr:nuclear transport factor 2 family protein [Dongia deserti]